MCSSDGECLPCKVTRLESEVEVLKRFANHKAACGCFICRNLTVEQRMRLATIMER